MLLRDEPIRFAMYTGTIGSTHGEMNDNTPAENARNGPVKPFRSLAELPISMRAIAKNITGTITAAITNR